MRVARQLPAPPLASVILGIAGPAPGWWGGAGTLTIPHTVVAGACSASQQAKSLYALLQKAAGGVPLSALIVVVVVGAGGEASLGGRHATGLGRA